MAKLQRSSLFYNLISRLHRESFLPSWLGVVTNPTYLIRNGLYKSVLRAAPGIKGSILDFGCGSKPYESLFVNADSYLGVDLKISGHDHRLSKIDVYYDGKTLPFPDNTFDAVVSFEVFEHIFNIDEMMREVWRVLKPGGQVLITIPFSWEEHESPYDCARYTSFGIANIFERNQYQISEVKKTTTYVRALCQMNIAYLVQYMLPRNTFSARVFQVILVFPLTLMSLFADAVLPKRYEYFCNCLVIACKGN